MIAMGRQPPFLSVRNLSKVYAPDTEVALHPVNLDLREGESVGVVGESGGGKTTLCRLLLGLTRPSSGSVSLRGERWVPGRIPRRKRWQVQGIFQDARLSLNPFMTVRGILWEGLRIWSNRAGACRVSELLEAVGLSEAHAEAKPAQLSGGEAQRVALARALIPRPILLVADEPFSGLDEPAQEVLCHLLLDLRARFGLTLLLVTHDLALVGNLVERVCVFRGGRLLEIGPTTTILERPAHPYTRSLVAALRFAPTKDIRDREDAQLREVGPNHWAAV